jgi:hypothetical protein
MTRWRVLAKACTFSAMRSSILALLCCLSFALSTVSARADDRFDADPKPRSGVGGIVVGWAGLGIAAVNAATLPLCNSYNADVEDVCVGASTVFIVGGLVAAIPGLVIGYKRRAIYKEWRARHSAGLRFETAGLDLREGRSGLNLRFSF